MLPIKIFRDSPELIRESERKRFREADNVDKVIEFDEKWRDTLKEISDLRAQRNTFSKQFATVAKSGDKEKLSDLKAQSKKIKEEIESKEGNVEELLKKRDEYRYKVGNILTDDVPIAEDEEGDVTVRTFGDISKFDSYTYKLRNHVELVESVDGADTKTASKVAGSRFYYLKNDIVRLNQALINFAMDILEEKKYTIFQTPFFTTHQIMKEAAELADFDEQLYKIEGEDLYLIATSEQTLAALHRGEILDIKTLPRKYCGYSTCFRKEAGSHGRDTLGIFRVHQFEKIEQFIYCKEENAAKFHEELIANSESIYKKLKLPYRVVNIASGELNDNAAKKYDLEAYFPASKTYRELVSCTNCGSYQATKLKIRYGTLGDKSTTKTAYTLNSTAIATERTMCAIMENYQTEDGSVEIPEALQSYMGGKTIISAKKQ